MDSKLSRWCEGVIEAGWLFALIATPLFFNIQSDRIFEPDKLTLLRATVLIMIAAWLIRFVERREWQTLGNWRPNSAESPLRLPLVVPVLLLVLIYIISTLASVTPFVSWAGSYQRLQGTYTTLSYIVIFGLILTVMRSKAQVNRLITTVILTSLPVALYGVLQHYARDPLPWGGDTQRRVAGHMGNAIFIGAYLIMAIPLTMTRILNAFRNILTDEDLNWVDVVQASIYMFALPVQLLALFWSGSRGPWLGLAAGLFALLLIMLVGMRNVAPRQFKAADLVWPLLFAVVGVGALFVSAGVYRSSSAGNAFAVFAGVLGLLFLTVLILLAVDRVWHWLWLSFLVLTLVVAGWLVAWNLLPDTDSSAEAPASAVVEMLDAWRELPGIGRLGLLLQDDGGTGRVRVLIWEGALDLLRPHDPLVFPDGTTDRFNALRLFIGYGPESMYVAYNKFYPPQLATLEARNASPDRSHNETFDALVITGIIGFSIWQALYLSVFYYAFKWLGVVRRSLDRNLLIGLWFGGAIVMTAVITYVRGPAYMGVSIPAGSIIGLTLYLVYYAAFGRTSEDKDRDAVLSWRRLTIIGLVAAVVAHYVEIHFGIAIAATRTHFFAYVATMVVVGHLMPAVQPAVEPVAAARSARRRRSRSDSGWFGPAVGGAMLLSLMLGILTFEYMNFTPRPGEMDNLESVADLPTVGDIIQRAYLVNTRAPDFPASPFLYGLILMSWLLGLLLLFSEMHKRGVFGTARPASPLPAQRKLTVGALALVAGLVAAGVGVSQAVGSADLVTQWGSYLAVLWGLAAAAAGGWLLLRDSAASRNAIGGVAAIAFLMALPIFFIGATWQGLLLAVVGGALLLLAWDDSWDTLYAPLVTMGVASIALALLMAFVQASLLRGMFIPPPSVTASTPLAERRLLEGVRVANFLTVFYVYAFGILLVGAIGLASRRMAATKAAGSTVGWAVAVPLLIVGFVLVNVMNLRVVHADMIYKRGKPFDQQAGVLARNGDREQSALSWDIAIALYEEAIDKVPREDFYYLWLGRAYLEKTNVVQEVAELDALLNTAERSLLDAQAINPLNTDHTANLARLNVRWANTEQDAREQRVAEALDYYDTALTLSPQNSIIRGELGGLYATLGNDCEKAVAVFEESLTIDPFYMETYYSLADIHMRCGAAAGGDARDAHYDDALAVLDRALAQEQSGGERQARVEQRVAQLQLAVAGRLADAGDIAKARTAAEQALTLAEPDFATQVETFLEQLASREQG